MRRLDLDTAGLRRGPRATLIACCLVALASSACWEQVDPYWFPQMKQQPAVQALEGTVPLLPPDGTIPVGDLIPRVDPAGIPAFAPEAFTLANPIEASPASIARGKAVYGIYCALCHGPDGLADAATAPLITRLTKRGDADRQPGESLLPVTLQNSGAIYTDGQVYMKIRYGRPLMPGYPQIPAEDRWHVVNYLRTLFPREG